MAKIRNGVNKVMWRKYFLDVNQKCCTLSYNGIWQNRSHGSERNNSKALVDAINE